MCLRLELFQEELPEIGKLINQSILFGACTVVKRSKTGAVIPRSRQGYIQESL